MHYYLSDFYFVTQSIASSFKKVLKQIGNKFVIYFYNVLNIAENSEF